MKEESASYAKVTDNDKMYTKSYNIKIKYEGVSKSPRTMLIICK